MEECIFKSYYDDGCVGDVLSQIQSRKKQNRIKSIIAASKNWRDTLCETLKPLFESHYGFELR